MDIYTRAAGKLKTWLRHLAAWWKTSTTLNEIRASMYGVMDKIPLEYDDDRNLL